MTSVNEQAIRLIASGHNEASWPVTQRDSSARPFARRRLRIMRPPRVAMRARKPCVRLRFSLLGW